MNMRSQLFLKLSVSIILMVWAAHTTTAEMQGDSDSLNNLYDNLLQREYIGQIAFPSHSVVERKAQRSPSLRLRFGRRSVPDQSREKRWFVGDVNQKPIRSPSLRLRFGRSDPSMPLHSPYDILMNERQAARDSFDEYNDVDGIFADSFVRKPTKQRLGRSLPFQQGNNDNGIMDTDNIDESMYGNLNDAVLSNQEDDFYNTLLRSQNLRNLLLSSRQFRDATNQQDETNDDLENDMNEFKRNIRKPGPLRLRWGRSTGGRSTQALNEGEDKVKLEFEQKKPLSPISNNVEKTDAAHNKD